MQRTAHVISENGETLIRLPEGIEPAVSEFDVRQDERSGQITLLPHRPENKKAFESLFKLLEEAGPMEEEFMAYRVREKQLYAEIALQAAKPATLDRFFEIQRAVGPGEEEFLADRDTSPSQPRDVF
jgi:hypothetical protein